MNPLRQRHRLIPRLSTLSVLLLALAMPLQSTPLSAAVAADPPSGAVAAVVDWWTGNISVVDVQSGVIVGTIAVGLVQRYATVAGGDGRVFITGRNAAGTELLVVADVIARQMLRSIPTVAPVLALALSPDQLTLYGAHENGLSRGDRVIVEYDVASLSARRTLATVPALWDGGAEPHALASMTVSPDGASLYISRTRDLVVVTASTGDMEATIVPGARPYPSLGKVVFLPSGSRAYAEEPDGSLAVIDTATRRVIAHAPVIPYWCGACTPWVLAPDGRHLLRGGAGGRIVSFDTSDNTVATLVPEIADFYPFPHDLVLDDVNNLLVTQWPYRSGPVLNGTLWAIDGASGTMAWASTLPYSSGPVFVFPPARPNGLTVDAVAATYGTTTTLGARLTASGQTLAGKRIAFQVLGQSAGEAVTDTYGIARVTVSVGGIPAGTYPAAVSATFAGDTDAPAAAVSTSMQIYPAIPVVDWSPAIAEAGLPLGAGQFNAVASVPGSFSYTPAPGTVVNAGYVTMTMLFTPDDQHNYESVHMMRENWPVNVWSGASHPVTERMETMADVAFDPVRNRMFVLQSVPPGQSCPTAWGCPKDLLVRDARTGAVLTTRRLSYSPRSLAVDVERNRLLIAGVYQPLRVLDAGSLEVLDEITVPGVETTTINVVVDGASGLAWVSGKTFNGVSDVLSAVDLDQSRIVASFPICGSSLVVNAATSHVYAMCTTGTLSVIDGDLSRPTFGQQIAALTWRPALHTDLALDWRRKELYVAITNADDYAGSVSGAYNALHIIDVDPAHPATFNREAGTIPLTRQPGPADTYYFFQPLSVAVNPAAGRLYVKTSDYYCAVNCGAAINVFDTTTRALLSLTMLGHQLDETAGLLKASPANGDIYVAGSNGWVLKDTLTHSAEVRADAQIRPVTVDLTAVSLTFSDITAGGAATATLLDPLNANLTLPGQFSIEGATAYEISTTATYATPITLCFANGVDDPDVFSSLVILHGVNGHWVAEATTHDFANRQLCATVSSLSPFVLARRTTSYQVEAVFDTTRAFRSGSTAPVKIRLLDAAGANASSAYVDVRATRLQRVSNATAAALQDAGSANADGNFRYDASIRAYIYNLSTKGLTSGTYVLSIRAAGDAAVRTVTLQVK
jgi:hypothetical protein